MMYNNFKVVIQILIFTCKRAMQHNIQQELEVKMSISSLYFCIHCWIFDDVNIILGVYKQQIVNDVQQF